VSALRVEERGASLRLSLARPPLNVLDLAAIRELQGVLGGLRGRRGLKVVVLGSAVPGVFSAGVDVADHAPERAPAMLEAVHEVFEALDALPQATIAAVDGHCLGGGCELAAFCDVLLCTPASRFGQPEIDVGCFPPVAAVLLPRILGRRALDLILGGGSVDAAEAERIGLATRMTGDLEAEVEAWVSRLASKSGAVLALARRAVRRGGQGALGESLAEAERLYREELLRLEDAAEGVRAFLEKRAPRWRER
jgi:cyclohexa-1,5-dienecarbonyl-CoA hydratase